LTPHELLALAVIARAMTDLRLTYHRRDALAFFEHGNCRGMCDLIGIDYGAVMARVEIVLDQPVAPVGRPREWTRRR